MYIFGIFDKIQVALYVFLSMSSVITLDFRQCVFSCALLLDFGHWFLLLRQQRNDSRGRVKQTFIVFQSYLIYSIHFIYLIDCFCNLFQARHYAKCQDRTQIGLILIEFASSRKMLKNGLNRKHIQSPNLIQEKSGEVFHRSRLSNILEAECLVIV